MWITLEEMGHPQPLTPIHCNNATAVGIANETVKKHQSRPMKMRYFYSCDQVKRQNFAVTLASATSHHTISTYAQSTYTQKILRNSYQEHLNPVM